MARPRNQLGIRMTEAQRARLAEIALENGLTGGPGVKPGEPNLSLAVRHLMGKADKVMAENDLDLTWDRSPQ